MALLYRSDVDGNSDDDQPSPDPAVNPPEQLGDTLGFLSRRELSADPKIRQAGATRIAAGYILASPRIPITIR
jgi:hypothetical protein